MRYVAVIIAGATLALTVADPALAGRGAESPEWLAKQKACKKEASAQHLGLSLSKKRAYIKECMSRA